MARRQPSDDDCTEIYLVSDIFSGLDMPLVLLLTKEAAQALVRANFQFADLSKPLLHESKFEQKLELRYAMIQWVNFTETRTSTEYGTALFFVFEDLAADLRVTCEAGLPIGVEEYRPSLLGSIPTIIQPCEQSGKQLVQPYASR
jgi:hypothetical protein